MNKLLLCLAGGMLLASTALVGEKKLMPCFYFTTVEGATQADWDAFYKATDEIPKKIKGVSHVWYGKLEVPLGQTNLDKMDADTTKKYRAGESVTTQITRTPRDWGICR